MGWCGEMKHDRGNEVERSAQYLSQLLGKCHIVP